MAGGFKSPLFLLGVGKATQVGYLTPHPIFISRIPPTGPGYLGPLPMFVGAYTIVPQPSSGNNLVRRIVNVGFLGKIR